MRIIARLNVGGPAIHVTSLNRLMNSGLYRSVLVTGTEGKHEGSMRDLAQGCGMRTIVVPKLGREIDPVNDFSTVLELYRLMRKERPHIVHTHTAKAGFAGRLAARLAGVPVIFHTFHGHVLKGYFGPLKSRLFLELERFCAGLSDRILTLSTHLREELVDLGVANRDRIAVVPLGLDLCDFTNHAPRPGDFRKECGIAAEDRLIAMVGRLVRIKNIPLFLDAAARVHRIDPRVRFAVVGDGEERKAVEAHARSLGLGGIVHFTGWRRDLPKIYADLDAVVISSDNEGTPVSLIEAMASGCPVVATRVGGVPDLLEDGRLGQIVPPRDPAGLADAILNTVRPRNGITAMTKVAKEKVLEKYSLGRLTDDMNQLYREVLSRKGLIVGDTRG
jgi:glycosyltransferase involved in cell wall biosynthesis